MLTDDFVTKWDLQVRIGGHLKEPIDPQMSRLDMRRMSYVQRMAKLLSGQLWETAGSPEVDPDRFAVVIGTGLGGGEKIVETYDAMNEGGPRKVSPLAVQMIMPNGAAAVVGLQLGARAGVLTPVSACSSGSEAIAQAWRQIVMGDADIAVCGGVEGGIEALPIAAFSMMRAMSTNNDDPEGASRPFDKNRDGFVIGEGAGTLILEELECALKRGAPIYGELLGYATNVDGFHITEADTENQARCIRTALADARIQPEQVDYVNAHGTSTQSNDRSETAALKLAFGDHARKLAISSNKSMMGHLLAGAGAVEAIFTLLTIRESIVPPTMNLETPDPECDLDYVPNVARPMRVDIAISESFGFGGSNAVVVLGKYGG